MLAIAAGGQNLDCVKILINNKANFRLLDSLGNSILHIAVNRDNSLALEHILKTLPENSLDLNTRNKAGETPYSIALANNYKDCVQVLEKYLLKQGDLT